MLVFSFRQFHESQPLPACHVLRWQTLFCYETRCLYSPCTASWCNSSDGFTGHTHNRLYPWQLQLWRFETSCEQSGCLFAVLCCGVHVMRCVCSVLQSEEAACCCLISVQRGASVILRGRGERGPAAAGYVHHT
jgi:hypothetical protein